MNVAIIGQMAFGKTTCSNYLVEKYKFKSISLAEPVYWVIENIEKYSPRKLYKMFIKPYLNKPLAKKEKKNLFKGIMETRKISKEYPKPRKRLQYFGTEVGRNSVRKSIWIDILLNRIKSEPKTNFVVDDVRFENELKALEIANFITIKLEISRACQEKRLKDLYGNFDKSILNHGSEIEIKYLTGQFTIKSEAAPKITYKKIDKILRGRN